MTSTNIKRLTVYPLKSSRGIERERLIISREKNLVGDREFALLSPDSTIVTARQIPKLVTLRFERRERSITLTRGHETWAFRDDDFLKTQDVPVIYFSKPRTVQTWNSEKFEDLMFQLFQVRLKLVKTESAFVDDSTLLLTNQKSFQKLHTPDNPITINAFRENILIEAEPWIENAWKKIRIGSVIFESTGPCARCNMIGIDPNVGTFDSNVVKMQRPLLSPDFTFGVYFRPITEGTIYRDSVLVVDE